MTIITSFYKVVVLEIGLFESIITDERHFGSQEEAAIFKHHIETSSNNLAVIVQM